MTGDAAFGQGLGGDRRREALVPGHDRYADRGPEVFHELQDLLCLRPDLARQVPGQAGHHLAHLVLGDESDDRLSVLLRPHPLDRGQAAGQGGGLVGERHADALVPHVQAEVTHTRV